ncbi:hypothetical protein PMAYCL1PPCAC_25498, partial [Pristionchus mayeri]
VIVLRCEIDANSLAHGIMPEPAVFDKRGLKWKTSIRPYVRNPANLDILLGCEKKWQGWNCKAKVKMVLHAIDGEDYDEEEIFTFDEDRTVLQFRNIFALTNDWIINNKVIVEFIIDIISSENGIEPTPIDLSKFCSPCETNNAALVMGDKRLRVLKDSTTEYAHFSVTTKAGISDRIMKL